MLQALPSWCSSSARGPALDSVPARRSDTARRFSIHLYAFGSRTSVLLRKRVRLPFRRLFQCASGRRRSGSALAFPTFLSHVYSICAILLSVSAIDKLAQPTYLRGSRGSLSLVDNYLLFFSSIQYCRCEPRKHAPRTGCCLLWTINRLCLCRKNY